MEYYLINLPGNTFPKKLTNLNESLYCFQSKQEKLSNYRSFGSNCLGLLVAVEETEKVKINLKNFLITYNIFRQEYSSITWFTSFDLNTVQKVSGTIEEIYKEHGTTDGKGGYYEDFNHMMLHIPVSERFYFSFVEVFKMISTLDENEFLYKALSYLSVINPVWMIANRLYENPLLEITLLFHLFDSIMLRFDPDDKSKVDKCETCNRVKQRSISKRINDFFEKEQFKSLISDRLKQALIKLANSRHKFAHALEGKTYKQYGDVLHEKLGPDKTIYVEEDIKFADGTTQTGSYLKAVCTIILFQELLHHS